MTCLCCLTPTEVHLGLICLLIGGLGLALKKYPRLYGGCALAFALMLASPYRDDISDGFFAHLCAFISRGGKMEDLRCDLLSKVHGRVLELGPGPGTSFACLKHNNAAITEWIGLDPNDKFAPLLDKAKKDHGITFPTKSIWMMAESAAASSLMKSSSFDFVIGTHVLCSVDDKRKVIGEAADKLKPGGKYLFLEHTLAPLKGERGFNPETGGENLRWWQHFYAPFFRIFGRGCRFGELWLDLEEEMPKLGLTLDMRFIEAPHALPILRPHVIGSATKPLPPQPAGPSVSTRAGEAGTDE